MDQIEHQIKHWEFHAEPEEPLPPQPELLIQEIHSHCPSHSTFCTVPKFMFVLNEVLFNQLKKGEVEARKNRSPQHRHFPSISQLQLSQKATTSSCLKQPISKHNRGCAHWLSRTSNSRWWRPQKQSMHTSVCQYIHVCNIHGHGTLKKEHSFRGTWGF